MDKWISYPCEGGITNQIADQWVGNTIKFFDLELALLLSLDSQVYTIS